MNEPYSQPSHFTTVDWIVLVVYFFGTMSIGFYFWRKTRSTEGFTAADRSLPGWVCGLSIFATYVSSISYLALPGKSFASNWNAFVFSLSLPIATWIAVKWFLPHYRSTGEISAYALLEHRFGPWARIYASVFYLLTQIAHMGVVMYLMALPLQVIFDWNIYAIILVTGLSVTVYAFVGGIVAVIWADALQAIVLMAGAVLCLVLILLNMPGGAGQVFSLAGEFDKFSLGELGVGARMGDQPGVVWFDLSSATFFVVLLYGVAINLQNFGIDQNYVQRYIASSSDREARKSVWLGGLLYIPVSALFFFIGTSLFAFYHSGSSLRQLEANDSLALDGKVETSSEPPPMSDIDEVRLLVAKQRLLQRGVARGAPEFRSKQIELARTLTLDDIGDRVFPYFIAKHLPPGLTGLLIAAVFAAAMSSVSTSLNSSATLLMSDYYKRFFAPHASERQQMGALYVATIVWGILGTVMALALVRLTESALDMWWTLSGIFGGGMCGLFLLGMVSRRAGNPAAVIGVVIGVLGLLWLSVPTLIRYGQKLPQDSALHRLAVQTEQAMAGWLSPLHEFMIPVLGTLTILLVGLLVSRFVGRTP